MITTAMNWKRFTESEAGELLAWASAQPWAERMRDCPQDPEWHPEGDVWTHTAMVVEEVAALDRFRDLPAEHRALLMATALLHDSGKPDTTRLDPDTNRLRSPKHSLVGASLARQVLRDLGCPLPLREHAVSLVRYHGHPPYLLNADHPEHEVVKLSSFLNNRLLYLFALADTRGRERNDSSRAEERLHLWHDLADEQACLEGPYPFPNDHARFLFHRNRLSHLGYTPHEDYSCTVTLMSGLPAAGKDTWLQHHSPGLPMVSLDALRKEMGVSPDANQGRVAQAAKAKCRRLLADGGDFAFNATNLTALARKRWIDLFDDYRARVEIIYLEPDLETVRKHNRARKSPVPEKVMQRLVQKLEVPTLAEAHLVRWTG